MWGELESEWKDGKGMCIGGEGGVYPTFTVSGRSSQDVGVCIFCLVYTPLDRHHFQSCQL